MKFGDLHPGVRILPPDSPPAGDDEINWEDTLGGRLFHACRQLEGLMYVWSGSRPLYSQGKQWRERPDPRCIWLTEIWRPVGCADPWDTDQSTYTIYQSAAHGDFPFDYAQPVVPIRSRSGDPVAQFARAKHAQYFPFGSVTRASGAQVDHVGEPTHDPISTTPLPNELSAEDVLITWTPHGVTPGEVDSVTLRYWRNGASGSTLMTWNAGEERYEATLSAGPHGETLEWHIDLRLTEAPAEPIYEPRVETPTQTNVYSFQWFTHYVRYPHGIPEANDTYGGHALRVSTDYHHFLPDETIQPAMINLLRHTLNSFGAGGGPRASKQPCQHNPRLRGSTQACCTRMPIRFRWSGANGWPHYVAGGKGGDGAAVWPPATSVAGFRPLHNGPNEEPDEGVTWGDVGARKPWRGMGLLFTGPLDNYAWGQGYSWETYPETFERMYEEGVYESGDVPYTCVDAGLQPGDLIDAVHIEEIIQAVEYLVSYGLWVETDIYSTKRTPNHYLGKQCGWNTSENWYYYNGALSDYQETLEYCDKCCEVCDGYETWWYLDGELVDYWFEPDPGGPYCTPWSKPTWAECWDGGHAKCNLRYSRTLDCSCTATLEPRSLGRQTDTSVNCNAGASNNGGSGSSLVECDPNDLETDRFHARISEVAQGWSAYICTPPRCLDGVDDSHGNGQKLNRRTGCPPNVTHCTNWPSFGNCFGDIHGCHEDLEIIGHADIWFQEVFGGVFKGVVGEKWVDQKSCNFPETGCGCPIDYYQELYPELPGVGLHEPPEFEDPLCEVYELRPGMSGFDAPASGVHCEISYTTNAVCNGTAIYAAIDQNLDGGGRPYRFFVGRDLEYLNDPYDGPGVPVLNDYDLSIADPPPDDCPCETVENPTTCC